MATTVDPSEASLALAVRLGIAKEGEPMTPLMSMLTTMKDYADHVDIGALAGTQASWATCIPHAEKLLELERKALEELRAKAAEWDSELSSRTGELAELDARFEEMTRETARVGEQLLDANQKQSEATKQLVKTLERTRLSQETHAKDEQRLKLKEDLLTTYSDDLEKRETSLASKEACLKHRWDELEAREYKMATTQKHAEESETQAKKHLDAIRNAHLTLSMLTERTGPETTKLSAHELVVGLQRLGSGIQDRMAHLRDQIAHLNDSRKIVEEAHAEAHEMGNREFKVLRDDVAAKASQIKKAELGAADYKSKLKSLQATSSERIHELELSKHNLLITKNSLEGRLSGALQNHKEMEAEYAKYKALERTEQALNNRIKIIEERLHVVERQRNDCVAANKTFEVENARLQKFEYAHLYNQKEVERYKRDRDSQMAELRVELEASKREARRLAEHCEDLKSQGLTNAKNVATNIERLQDTHRDEINRVGQGSEAKILELEETVKRQEEQLKNVEKLATKREDSLRKADDINTSLYNKLKDGVSAIESANKCRMEHQDFDNLKCRLRELQTQVERLSRARIVDREADVRTIKTLKSEKTALQHEVSRFSRITPENRTNDSRTIKTLEGRIAQLELDRTEDRKTDVQTIGALRSQNANLLTEVERLSHTITDDSETTAQTIQTLKSRAAQLELEKAEVETEYRDAVKEFALIETKMKELECAEAEAKEGAMTADRRLRTYQETIQRLRSERDEARDEIESAKASHANDLDDARQARQELESLQQRVTPENQNGQKANKMTKRKRPAAEMLEDDMPVVPAVGHAYDLQEIRDPEFTDPNIPSEVLDKLHKQFDRWDQKSGRGWTRQITKSRCVEARCAKVSTKHLHGNGHACNYCEDRGRVCVVIRQPGIVNILPVHQDGEAVGPEIKSYWTK